MCGIAGFYGQGDKKILVNMTRTLRHRGPDDEGFYIDENKKVNIGLGQRRLAIIDLSPAGHQPMSNEDRTIWITFNGEIYNFQELRKELGAQHKLKSNSDTEVIIHLYEEIGAKVFEKLNGMFALAIYDKNQEKLILARDRMGKKPLYWARWGNTLAFASELKALHPHPQFKKEMDLDALNKYLAYEYVPGPQTIFKNINKLSPGHYLEYDGKDVKIYRYWDIDFKKTNVGFLEAKMALDERLARSVSIRLVSDVPLGIFLSGGIDSSTIAYYAQKASTQKIKTFSIRFREKSFDESSYARQVAEYLGTDHYETLLSAKDSLDLIPRVADIMDEPLADPSLVPTYLLSKFTRQYVTVVLGGDGGDELFCGYDPFIAQRVADYYEYVPKSLNYILMQLANTLPVSFSNISLDFKIKSFLKGFKVGPLHRHQEWLGSFNQSERKDLFLPEIQSQLVNTNAYSNIDDLYADRENLDLYQKIILFYLRFYLLDDILVKVDRASMANSLEVRAPFLDYEIVDYVNSLPLVYKMNGLNVKYILKETMRGKLPNNIIGRRKKGFGLPIAEWLAGDLKPLVLDLLSEDKIKRQGLFDYTFIDKLLSDHFDRRHDNRKQIWTLLVFQMWRERWCK